MPHAAHHDDPLVGTPAPAGVDAPRCSHVTLSQAAREHDDDDDDPESARRATRVHDAEQAQDESDGHEPLQTPRLSHDEARRYRRLVDGYFDAVWRTLVGLGVPARDADDHAQKVFLIVLRKLDAIAEGRERGFVLSVATRVASNARRSVRRSRESIDDDALAREIDPGLDPEQQSALLEQRRLLARILATMPDDLRQAFVLHELEGVTTTEMAEICDIPTGTAASRLRRARAHFRAELEASRCTQEQGR